MYIVKGFVSINSYVNNTPGVVAPLGELSNISRTYSKEKIEYQTSAFPEYHVTAFSCLDAFTGNHVVLPGTLGLQIVQVVNDIIHYASTHIRPYDVTDYKNVISADYYGRISNLAMGPFVDNGTVALPQWLSWISDEHNGFVVKVWLSDDAFQNQYDEHAIVVVPPLANLDDFFGLYNVVSQKLDERDIVEIGADIQTARSVYPETYLRFLNFDFKNVNASSESHKSTWTVLIYGRTGDNIDTIKDSIVEHVLRNSAHTFSEWEVLLPDLFKRTEFTVLPRWDKLSIPNLAIEAGLYSSMLDPKECIDFAKVNVGFYPTEHIANNLMILPYDYKAISLMFITGTSNIVGKRSLQELVNDYIPVPSTSPDFSRMQLYTQEWLVLIGNLLVTAESATDYSSISNDLRKIKRNGDLFISAVYDNVNYLVAAKSNSYYS